MSHRIEVGRGLQFNQQVDQRGCQQSKFFTAALEHYKNLPAIEQAQYPNSYEAKLQGWIALGFNYKTNTVEGKGSAQDVMDKVLSLDKQTFDDGGADSA